MPPAARGKESPCHASLLRALLARLARHLLLHALGPLEALLAREARQLPLLARALVDHRDGVVVVLVQVRETVVDKAVVADCTERQKRSSLLSELRINLPVTRLVRAHDPDQVDHLGVVR